MSDKNLVCDVTIIGAGPVGLAAAYYVGHRGASCRIIESLQQLGGQISALYPEKTIFDIAGREAVKGQAFIDEAIRQGLQYDAEVVLGEASQRLERISQDGEELWLVGTPKGEYISRAIIITAGHGAFEPRRLPIEGGEAWEGRGLEYAVTDAAKLTDKHVVIVGGGDAALDWAYELSDIAGNPIRVVHRREQFRGKESTLAQCRQLEEEGKLVLMTPCEVRSISGNGKVEAVSIENTATGEIEEYPCDSLLTLLGFISRLGEIADWGLELVGKKQISVSSSTMKTSLPLVWAAGDIAGYEGKITMITVGLAEAAIAANNAVAEVRDEKPQPKYSSE